MDQTESYDVIVVGAGSAGCVLAARLTEDPGVRVLLLEAGGDDRVDEIQIPAAFSKQFRTRLDWGYSTQEQKHAQGRRLYWPRGKALGGSSSMNAMIYIRGSRHDYDEWAALTGDPAWSYERVLPYFRRSEDNVRGASALPRRRRAAAGRGAALAAPVDARLRRRRRRRPGCRRTPTSTAPSRRGRGCTR